MSSTALSLPPFANPMPLFFRLDLRSQRLVALTDVMQTPAGWLDAPDQPWPAQLPASLQGPINAQLASGQGGELTLRSRSGLWQLALSPEQGSFWLICLRPAPLPALPEPTRLQPKLAQLAAEGDHTAMLAALREGCQADRLILWHFEPGNALVPVYQLGVDDPLPPIREESRYLRALRSRGALSFSECAQQPMLARHTYLAGHGVRSRLDAAVREGDRLIGVLSLEFLTPAPLGEALLALTRFCANQLGQWQPSDAGNTPTGKETPLALHTGFDYCRELVRWCQTLAPQICCWVGEYQWRGEELWIIPRYVERNGEEQQWPPLKLDPGPALDISRSGQALYVDELKTRYPHATTLHAADATAYIGIPLQLPDSTPLGQITLLLSERLADPLPLMDRLSELAPRAAIELHRLATEDALRLAEVAFETHEALLVCDPNGQILKVNRAFTRVTGIPANRVVGEPLSRLRPCYYGDDLNERIRAAVANQGYWEGEEQCLNHEGRFFPIRLQVSGVFEESGQLSHYVASFEDVTREHENQQHIEQLAYYDDLTGLRNRRSILDLLASTLTDPQGLWGALLLIDLDNFKSINDSLGHQQGDTLLKEVVSRLQSLPQENLTIARSAGDEFLLLFTSLGQGQVTARILAEHFAREVQRLFRQPFMLGDDKLHCSASLGVSLYAPGQPDPLAIMQQADTAAHMAKRSGQGQFAFFTPEMANLEKGRLAINNRLRDALRNNEFQLHYQPQFRVDSGELTGLEALLRWQQPDGTMVPPGEFIPVAEESGLIEDLGYWVLKSACAQMSHWLSQGLVIPRLSVNVSARQFHTPNFLQQVEYVLRDTGLSPASLMLEITESVVLEQRQESIKRMHHLNALGVLISIDDFGTGYSSLAYMRDLPAAEVKLDRSFIQTLVNSKQDRAIVQAIVGLARVFGFSVIAEGVEQQDQLAVLEELGCHDFQGYLRCRPLPVRALEAFVRTPMAR